MNKKGFVLKLLCILLFIFSSVTFQPVLSAPSNYTEITVNGILNAIGDSSLTLSIDFSNTKITGISLCKGNKISDSKLSISGKNFTVSPISYLEGGSKYQIKIFTKENKKYIANVTAVDTYDYDVHDKRFTAEWWAKGSPSLVEPTGHRILEISAKPDKGFNYPYFILIPAGTIENKDKKLMIVAPNNTGYPSNSLKVHGYSVQHFIRAGGASIGESVEYHVATAIKTPLIIPVFPRPWIGSYTHALDRDTMLISSGDMKRLDLQLIAMINNAKEVLSARNINVENKVFMTGFSASGQFTQRFSVLHPEIVEAIAVGNFTCFPVKQWNNITLPYPFGIADIEQISGQKFNETEYRKIAQFSYAGDKDPNDVIHPNSGQDKVGYEIERGLLGDTIMVEKWNARQELVKKMGFADPIQFNTYWGIGHSYHSENIYSDIINLFKANTGEAFTRINVHENAF